MAPADAVNPLYVQFAKLEEDYGLAKRAMEVYDQATKAVPNHEKLGLYEIHIARAAEIFGVPKIREIYEQAIESGLPDKDTKTMCLKYAGSVKSLGEIDRARGIYVFASQFAEPCPDADFWDEWRGFEVQHGNEYTSTECFCKL
ncbi:pre-mRNA-splicing factor syf1-like [Herrania umbratica]|uniref:Pre-mRNA-splicing factor syf1-like n=1 Tax=Herrania umbratica TaxID=108875 RepID=A0A6J1B893_9ROSI|nr:pre-mRNA-splicing factor syf1-like [Herrania umbratica]